MKFQKGLTVSAVVTNTTHNNIANYVFWNLNIAPLWHRLNKNRDFYASQIGICVSKANVQEQTSNSVGAQPVDKKGL